MTHGGALVVTHITGEVVVWADGRRRTLGCFGYDIVPPAVYPDDSLAIAGYEGAGLVRVEPDGSLRWRAAQRDPDYPPAIDAEGFAVVGSANAHRSIVVDRDGRTVGIFDRVATFAEADGGGWFALADDGLARIGRDGSRRWTAPLAPARGGPGSQAPVADASGSVYVLATDTLLGLDARTGAVVLAVELGGAPRSTLALVAPGVAAVLVDERLLIIT